MADRVGGLPVINERRCVCVCVCVCVVVCVCVCVCVLPLTFVLPKLLCCDCLPGCVLREMVLQRRSSQCHGSMLDFYIVTVI